MSWPPEGIDLSLTGTLLDQAGQQQERQRSVLAIDSELNALRDEAAGAATPTSDLISRTRALIDSAENAGQPEYAAQASLLLADLLLNENRAEEALAELDRGRTRWASQAAQQEAAGRTTDTLFLERMAQARFLMKDYRGVDSICAEAIREIELDRYKTSAPYLQNSYLRSRINIYKHGVGASYKLEDYQSMLARAELTKARSLLRYIGNGMAPGVPGETERQFRALSVRVHELERLGDHSQEGDRRIEQLQGLRRNLWDLLTIARLRPNGDNPRLPEFSLERVRHSLACDEAILYYFWLDSGVLLVALIGREDFQLQALNLAPQERRSLNDVLSGVSRFQGLMADEQQRKFDRAIASCSFLIPQSFGAALEKKRELIFCPHQRLHLFPFHALPWGQDPLIVRFRVSYAPNLTVLGMEHNSPKHSKALFYSPGQYDPSLHLRNLPESGREIEESAQSYRRGGIDVQAPAAADLTQSRLWEWSDSHLLGQFSVIHLATHGISVLAGEGPDNPMQSRIYLQTAALDGLEISRLRLDADLIVLSACNSGQRAIQGRGLAELPGDELFGMQAAFAMAGARAVLGCLWPVIDKVAADLMIRFHQCYAGGLRPAIALQKATVEHLRSGNSTRSRSWAPFFVSILGPRISNQKES